MVLVVGEKNKFKEKYYQNHLICLYIINLKYISKKKLYIFQNFKFIFKLFYLNQI